MPNIINPTCLSLPQQVEKNRQDILKILASNLEELSGLQFIPNNLIYQNQQAVISGKFIVIRDETSTEIDGVVNIPFVGENGIVVDGSEDNLKIRIALDQTDRELFNFVQELVDRTTESDEIVFTSDMENFVSEAMENVEQIEVVYDKDSDDININKGLTSGMRSGEYAIDLSKYKRLIITTKEGYRSTNFVMNLYNKSIDGDTKYLYNTCYGYLFESNIDFIYNLYSVVNADKNLFSINLQRVNLSDHSSRTDLGVVTKIEGVF